MKIYISPFKNLCTKIDLMTNNKNGRNLLIVLNILISSQLDVDFHVLIIYTNSYINIVLHVFTLQNESKRICTRSEIMLILHSVRNNC